MQDNDVIIDIDIKEICMHYEFFKYTNNCWYWGICGFDGKLILTSGAFISKAECIESINGVRNSIEHARIFDRDEDRWL